MNIHDLAAIIQDRKTNPQPDSYTNTLFDAGMTRIAQKVGEEGVEVVIAGLAESDEELLGEVVDWLYHVTVLLTERGLTWEQVETVMTTRHQTKSAED